MQLVIAAMLGYENNIMTINENVMKIFLLFSFLKSQKKIELNTASRAMIFITFLCCFKFTNNKEIYIILKSNHGKLTL